MTHTDSWHSGPKLIPTFQQCKKKLTTVGTNSNRMN